MSNDNRPDRNSTSNWQLPDGIENALESGIIMAFIGTATGAMLGTLMFKSGKGYRAAGAAMGVGVAVGSTVERAWCSKST